MLLVLSLLFNLFLSTAQNNVISVLGSSVANGVGCGGNCSGVASASTSGGCFQSRLKVFQAQKDRSVFNNCNNGDNSNALIARFAQVLSVKPKFVFIALGLESEGLLGGNAQTAVEQLESGLKSLINMSRASNIRPVVGLSYPNSAYTPFQYNYVKRMNLLIQTWDVPTVNFLGAVDNGKGQWVSGYSYENSLPNDEGSTLMYHAIVPSLWEAIENDVPLPPSTLVPLENTATLSCQNGISGYAKIVFTPTESAIFSWTMSITIDPDSATAPTGVFATIVANASFSNVTGGNFSLERGVFRYNSLLTNLSLDDPASHQITVAHNYPAQITKVYIDGVLRGQVAERLSPTEFTLQGGMCVSYPFLIKHWLVHRTCLNEDDVSAMYSQNLVLPASLEVYAPLDELTMYENKAQSMSVVDAQSLVPTMSKAPTTRTPTRMPTSLAPSYSPTVEMPTEAPEDESSYDAQIAIFATIVSLLVLGVIGWKIYKCHQSKRVGVVELGQETEMK